MSAEPHLRHSERDESERLRRLLWECYCAGEDGVPVPFNRWLMDGGVDAMPDDIRELRDAFDTHTERMDAAEAERDRYREALELIAGRSPFGTSSEAAVIALALEALDG